MGHLIVGITMKLRSGQEVEEKCFLLNSLRATNLTKIKIIKVLGNYIEGHAGAK